MSKGLPLPLAAAMVFGTCLVAGGGGYYLARERFKSPTQVDPVRSQPAAVPDVVITPPPPLTPPPKVPVPAVTTIPADAKHVSPPRLLPEPVKIIAAVPTLEEVLNEARRLVNKQMEDEPAATARRIKDEVGFMNRVNMQNMVNNFRTHGTLPKSVGDLVRKLGLFELYTRLSLQNTRFQENTSVVEMISSHYNMSLKTGDLTLDKEAAWVVESWSIIGLTTLDQFVTAACNEASRYFKSGEVGLLYGQEPIALYKALTSKR